MNEFTTILREEDHAYIVTPLQADLDTSRP
jgi:hypothetical protein